ncbi:YdcF family protein [Calditerrivibrio nitroreducens]|uniref:YdcF family protein n=1 Tax=Calditerrivibrio nitroreducens TaxID=477976 RepID=UPI003C710935
MIFLKKLLYYFIIPPGIFIVGFFIGACLLKGWKRYLMIFFAVMLYLFSISPVKDMLIYPIEKDYINLKCDGDIIVVLGGGVYGNGELSEDAFKRVLKGYEKGRGGDKIIIVSGGRVSERYPYEAEVMKTVLVGLGIPEKQIIMDKDSKDTVENAKFTKKIMEEKGINGDVILITSAYHMKRGALIFKKYGFDNICAVATDFRFDGIYSIYDFLPSASNLNTVSKVLKEYMGILFYNIK